MLIFSFYIPFSKGGSLEEIGAIMKHRIVNTDALLFLLHVFFSIAKIVPTTTALIFVHCQSCPFHHNTAHTGSLSCKKGGCFPRQVRSIVQSPLNMLSLLYQFSLLGQLELSGFLTCLWLHLSRLGFCNEVNYVIFIFSLGTFY